MATSTNPLTEEILLPDGVVGKLDGYILQIRGPLGAVSKDFSKIPVVLKVSGDKVVLTVPSSRRRDKAVLGTAKSIISNMVIGVTKGFTYKLKVVYAHFPITVRVKDKTVYIENFYGERSPRTAEIVGECKVQVQGEDVIVTGIDKEHVGATAANIEQATRIKRKDQRVFLDGIYIYEKVVNP
ncbi:MAG: 50S ribosomal protein L6 [Nitrososphaerales archaeon]